MNLLAIDTATDTLSVAIGTAGTNGAASSTWLFEADAGLRHSELAMDSIDQLMRKAALQPSDLSGVVCMGGPGSFTGLRIGFSIAKGLALALGIPFAPIPTLDCMARPFSALPELIVPVIDAKQKAFFCAIYHGGKCLCPGMDAVPETIAAAIAGAGSPEKALLIGPGAELLYGQLTDRDGIILGKGLPWGNAATLLDIAMESGVIAHNGAAFDCGPEYIRKSDAELSRMARN